ncbi:MAG: DUF998 domain-containing protein [Thermoplasmata archaeon]|nr:DUF998 domain-containing protein [Thermoplasmata archaeon]NIS14576.1 DUF998 domain-containing protein [Thermoplasmata archaeon]NIV81140.1 DUF998 domain-containing protein [Thermoplasmata archaeon]NIW91274.1 DUF998 domain-containing protein [Thermoplasmata archaeon]
MEGRLTRVGVVCGILSPVVFMVLYTIAARGDPEYVFFENYLSDLGVGNMAVFFNAAVIIAGALTIPFAVLAVRPALDGGIAATAAVALTVVGAVFLILVGVFTEDFEGTHYIVSVGFFMTMLLALTFYSFTLYRSNALGTRVTELTMTVTAVGILLTILGFNPQTETVAVLAIVVWGLFMALTLFRRGTEADTY